MGTGKPLREFIHAEDLASAIFFTLNLKKNKIKNLFKSKLPIINIGTKDEISIKKLANLISQYIGFNGQIIFDKKSPDGTYRKNLDKSLINKLGWSPNIDLKNGLKEIIEIRKKLLK